MKNITTARQLRSALKYWQKELGLQGWALDAEFVHPDKIDSNDARTDWRLESSSAVLQIVRPRHNSKPIEQRLIHECLHCRIPLYPQDETARQIFEAGIDATADLIYCLAFAIHELSKKKRKPKLSRKELV